MPLDEAMVGGHRVFCNKYIISALYFVPVIRGLHLHCAGRFEELPRRCCGVEKRHPICAHEATTHNNKRLHASVALNEEHFCRTV